MPWVNETICNCTGASPASPLPAAGSASRTHVGRAPVYLPYVGMTLAPCDGCVSIPAGFNYAFPKDGKCREGAPLGADGCTWRRAPSARMLYGDDLLAAGWDRAFVPDTDTNVSHTLANVAAFAAAVKARDKLVLAPPCG